jgi:glycosyltransferase involved in cell wall biosynthesis
MWFCSQIGAREHYAVARALHQQGLLAGLVTDWYAFGGNGGQRSEVRDQKPVRQTSDFRLLTTVIRSPAARAACCVEIPDDLVQAFPWRSLLWKWRRRQMAKQGCVYEGYAQTDAAFAVAVAQLKLPPHDVFFGYSYASLEMLQAEKKREVLTVLDQIDPGPAEFRLVAEEMRRHPELAGGPSDFPTAYYERNQREWKLADIIVVNSEWSREAIIAEGADSAKIEVLPLAYEAGGENWEAGIGNRKSEIALRVLWLGQVNVRKGIHYLMQAARLLERENVQFDVVGPIGILSGAVAAAPRNMTFHGPVSRDYAAAWFRQADVFVLPTLSDGFALTQLEALAHGIPVIITPNCGRVVEEGKTGFIVPPRDPQALTEAILQFVRRRELALEMAPACRAATTAYSIETLGQRLVAMVKKHQANHVRSADVRSLTSDLRSPTSVH